MTETSKLEKLADIKYFLLIVSFTLLLDIFLLHTNTSNITILNTEFLKKEIDNMLIFLCFYSLYVAILSKFVTVLFMTLFEMFKIKKNIHSYNIEYYKLLTKSFNENNSVMYNYAQKKLKEQEKLFEGISLYYGTIVLFLFDWLKYDSSIVDLLLLEIVTIFGKADFLNALLFIIILGAIFLSLTIVPFILLREYISERNLIRINNLIKKDILEKSYKK